MEVRLLAILKKVAQVIIRYINTVRQSYNILTENVYRL